jgi:hypothetical protein
MSHLPRELRPVHRPLCHGTSLRGLHRVTGEWAFQNTVTNLLKIHATGYSPAPA